MKEKTEDDFSSSKTEKVEVWDSDWAPSKLRIIIDSKLLSACKYIQDHIDGKEFSILAKGEFINDGFYVRKEYYVPEQEVETASVDYKENIALKRDEGYNTVIHSHPFSESTSFSGADAEHINSHFMCSILLNKYSKPVDSIVNIPIDGRYLQFKVEDIAEGKEVVVVSATDMAKIKKHEYVSSKYVSYDYTNSAGKQTSITTAEDYLADEEQKWERDYARDKGKYTGGFLGWDGSDY